MIDGHHGHRLGWFRVFGYGLHWKDTSIYPLLWSERERVYWQFNLGHWRFTPLNRRDRGFRRRTA